MSAACLSHLDSTPVHGGGAPQTIFKMFQTFSGSSRRPRQVNLSGQNLNPFAANSWTPSAIGSKQTLAHAQQERQQRHQERERLNASKRIQRVWRGHRTRKAVANSRRATWDELDTRGSYAGDNVLIQLSGLLITFFSPRRQDDVARLTRLSSRISADGSKLFVASQDVQVQLVRLANVTLEALQV